MATPEIPCAASSLLTGLVDGRSALVEVARTRVSVHYETGRKDVPVLTFCTPDAVRLPNSLVTDTLPHGSTGRVADGRVRVGRTSWRVRRWWQPPCPRHLPRPHPDVLARSAVDDLPPEVPSVRASYDGLAPAALIGAGPGLTPAGDDLVAGALVAAHATDDPRLNAWRASTRAMLTRARTTAVSRAMLHHALDGYATPELAAFTTDLCHGRDTARSRADLLAVGHSSGSALLAGVLHTLSTNHLEGAA